MPNPLISISGRADLLNVALAARFFSRQGENISNKSQLVYLAFSLVAKLAPMLDEDVSSPDLYEEALNDLEALGITFPGDRHSRDLLKAHQVDGLRDLDPEQRKEVISLIADLRKKGAKQKEKDFTEIEKSLNSLDRQGAQDLSFNDPLLNELEEIDRELSQTNQPNDTKTKEDPAQQG